MADVWLGSDPKCRDLDIGKNSFHIVGLDRRRAIVLRQKWSRGQVEARLAAAKERLRHYVLAIALANKLTRVAWSVLDKGRNFECVRTKRDCAQPG